MIIKSKTTDYSPNNVDKQVEVQKFQEDFNNLGPIDVRENNKKYENTKPLIDSPNNSIQSINLDKINKMPTVNTLPENNSPVNSNIESHNLFDFPHISKKKNHHVERDYEPIKPRKSSEEIQREKQELLYKFDQLERKGVKLPRRFNMSSNIEEMQCEYNRLKQDRERLNSLKFSRKC